MYSAKLLSFLAIFYTALFLLVSCRGDSKETKPSITADASVYDSPHLLSVEEASVLLNTSSPPLLLEISKPEKYAQGHVPGALNIWRPDYEDNEHYPYGGMRGSRLQMAQLLSSLGAQKDSLIIVYCTKGNVDAARFLWIMRGYGHNKIALMDGGKKAWQKAGLAITTEPSKAAVASDYQFPQGVKQTDCAYFNDIVTSIGDSNVILIDTREDYEFLGSPYAIDDKVVPFKPGAYTQGNIPGAIHMNWSESVDLHGDHTFKSMKDLRYNFDLKGITPEKSIIVYCQSGVRSAHTLFVLTDILGYPDVRNYDGSWIEWSYLHAKNNLTPIENHTNQADAKKIHAELLANIQPIK